MTEAARSTSASLRNHDGGTGLVRHQAGPDLGDDDHRGEQADAEHGVAGEQRRQPALCRRDDQRGGRQRPHHRREHPQPGQPQRQDGPGDGHDAGAHDGGEPVRAEVAEHVRGPLKFFEEAERVVVIRLVDPAGRDAESLRHGSRFASSPRAAVGQNRLPGHNLHLCPCYRGYRI
jgi:hypothetical protein